MTGQQSRIVFGLAKEVGLSTDNLRDLAVQLTGQDSLRTLSEGDVKKVIARLRELRGQKHIENHRPGRATGAQLWKQRELAAELGLTDAQLTAFVRRMTKVDRLEWQSQEHASNVIEALKKMVERGGKPDDTTGTTAGG